MEKSFFVYILATRKDGPLYVGVTSNLPVRIAQHKAHVVKGFTERFNVDRLVWFEAHENADHAREADQAMEAGLEGRTDREGRSRMAGFV